MVLIVAVPASADVARLRADLEGVARDLHLVLSLRDLPEQPLGSHGPAAAWILSVYGADRPGIVYRVTSLLADRQVNVTDVDTRVVPGPVYIMLLELALPPGLDATVLQGDLAALGGELEVEMTLRRLETAQI